MLSSTLFKLKVYVVLGCKLRFKRNDVYSLYRHFASVTMNSDESTHFWFDLSGTEMQVGSGSGRVSSLTFQREIRLSRAIQSYPKLLENCWQCNALALSRNATFPLRTDNNKKADIAISRNCGGNRTTEFCLQLIDLFVRFCFISF